MPGYASQIFDRLTRAWRRILAGPQNGLETELARLRRHPPMQAASTNLFGRPFELVDTRSFLAQYDFIFTREGYGFQCGVDDPLIIDCGANVGVSVAWWKQQYPRSRVVAFEADPAIFSVLSRNCSHLSDVRLIHGAVWHEDTTAGFVSKGGGRGHLQVFSRSAAPAAECQVPCLRLSDFLRDGCDFLKLDIEGAEVDVLRDSAHLLGKVDQMFVEYHSFTDRPQRLAETMSYIETAGFRVHVHVELPSPRPFQELLEFNEKDLRLDLFCTRGQVPVRRIGS